MSLFAQELARRGHEVLWWSSTFDHTHKRQRSDHDETVRVSDRLELRLIHARAYNANISVDRLVNHHQIARGFERIARTVPVEELPDLIFATMPTVELAAAAAQFGRARGIPVIVDVRDLHPDIYLSLVPSVARPLAKLALTPLYRDLRTALRLATGLIAIAPSFLEWALRHAERSIAPTDRVFPLAYPELDVTGEAVAAAGAALRQAGVRTDRKILWYVGTFNRWIDLDTVIKAAAILDAQGRDDIQFVLSGSGGFDAEWRRQAAPLSNVVFTGWIDIPKIAYMRGIASAGLAPYQPGFLTVGNKLFEYMAGGLPILLSIGGDAKDIIEQHDAGIAYEGKNPDSLVAAAIAMLADDVQARMAANSLRAYRDHYSAEKVYGDMADFVLGFAAAEAHAKV
jgi:glycosyltransferase involved in cell wall biosynthesis